MQVSVVTSDNLKREELDGSKILKLEVCVGDTVFAIRERDGELCVSICVFHLKSAKHSDRNTAIYNDALPATDFDAKTATYSEQNPPARRVSKRGIGVRIRPRRVGVSPAASASTLPSTRSADYR